MSQIGRSRVLILGDVMLDEYLFGSVERISPEAPVPVVEIQSDKLLLGGAANVTANIRALDNEPILIGTVGDDDAAQRVRRLLAETRVSSDHLVVDKSRRTTIKTRIIAHNQQVVRADREDRRDLDREVEEEVYNRILKVIDSVQALVLSDYGKGVITLPLLERVIALCLQKGVFVAVDPKETRFLHYKKVSVITPNHHEAGFAAGRRIRSEEDLLAVGQTLLDKLEARSILITRGPEGMSLFQRDAGPTHIPTFAREVYDVTGAGDTVIAAFVSAVCAGADLVEAAIVSNAAAGFTVRQIGTATITRDQLKEELERNLDNGNVRSVSVSS
ncbi:MAG: D-glycero-beta-D-manno-heptose-7-phosphate kinase [candidate division Zixibacteria bacterium]|nr:D-glycero-beta-D-manno-heptose-7-phosphate kinase [candidate division Zixibacteria bacterium]